MEPAGLLPPTPVAPKTLVALADGERHGYAMVLEAEERTGGGVRPGPGTIHGAAKRFGEGGPIEDPLERPDPAPDDRRRYYGPTDLGVRVLAAEVGRLEAPARAVRSKDAYSRPEPRLTPGEA